MLQASSNKCLTSSIVLSVEPWTRTECAKEAVRSPGEPRTERSDATFRAPGIAPSSVALVSNSFLFLLVRHLLLEAMHLLLVAICS